MANGNRWFRVNKAADCIWPVDVDRRRKAINHRDGAYFKEFADAKEYLVRLRRQDLDHAEWVVRNAMVRLADVEALREPEL